MNYKEILKGIVQIINTTEKSDIGFANICTYIGENCPELAESEDERMRKFIKNQLFNIKKTITENYELDAKLTKAIEWLEKQGGQNNAEDEDILHRFSFYSYKDEPNVLYLSGLYVNEECRNKGMGTKILEVADEVAKSLNCHAIRLKTKKDSNAERLYRTHGYNSLALELQKDEIWLEKQRTSNEAIEYLKKNHSPSEISDFQAAMNIAVAKAYNKGKRDAEKQGKQKPIETTWKPSEEQIKILDEILNFAANHESPYWNDYIFGTLNNLIRQLKKLKA